MKLYRKYFSKKHDENWYRGEETENQKKNRKALTKSITTTGTVYGGMLGGYIAHNKAGNKVLDKKLNALSKDLDKTVEVADVISKYETDKFLHDKKECLQKLKETVLNTLKIS